MLKASKISYGLIWMGDRSRSLRATVMFTPLIRIRSRQRYSWQFVTVSFVPDQLVFVTVCYNHSRPLKVLYSLLYSYKTLTSLQTSIWIFRNIGNFTTSMKWDTRKNQEWRCTYLLHMTIKQDDSLVATRGRILTVCTRQISACGIWGFSRQWVWIYCSSEFWPRVLNVHFMGWRWKQYVSPKRWESPTSTHKIIVSSDDDVVE